MKLTVLLVLVGVLQVSATVNGQMKVSLSLSQTEIGKVLSHIEKQTSYRFLYNNALKGIQQKISIDVHEAGINDVLNTIFTGTDLTYKMLENNLIVVLSATQTFQNIQVTGKITGQNGEPLSGVSVTVKGSTKGTATDSAGNFTLSVPQDGTLRFTYIGYLTLEMPINNQTQFNIQLKPVDSQLGEVVVVGYGTQKKIDITGSVVHVKGDELAKQPVLTATQALQGKAAGVQITSSGQPGSMPTVVIRGTGSILAGAGPLYIVDGIWTDDITNINTADISSVDVLKDASACSIYGVRGANGVILITTRQGSGKMRLNYNNNIGVQQAAFVVPMADATQYLAYIQATTGLPSSSSSPYNTNWFNQILRTAFYQNHNLSISGSSAQDHYALSVGYLTNDGIIINNDYKRYTIRFNNEFSPTTFIKIGTTASFASQASQNVPTGTMTEDAYRAAPLVPAMVNGKFGNTSQYQNVGNPVLTAQGTNDLSHNNKGQGDIYVEVRPVRSVIFKSNFGDELNFYDDRQYTYQHPNDTTFFNVNGGSQGPNRSLLAIGNVKNYHWVWSNTVDYNQSFGKSRINLLGGTEAQEYYSVGSIGSRYNVPTVQSEWYLQDGDATTQANGSSVIKYTTNSYFGRLVYNFDDRFLFTGNFRADASSVFNAKNRWGYFPGVSAGWVISKENFMRGQKIFQYLKLKASWGELGNSNIPADATVTTVVPNLPYFFNSGNSASGATSGSAAAQVKDLNLKWEITKESDLGFEYSILAGRLSGEFDVYDKKASNALIYIQVPGTFGSQADPASTIVAGEVLANAATIDNRGLEFSARWHDNINSKISYFIGGNVSFNRNKVLNLNGGLPFFDGNINGYYTTETKTGYPIGAFFMRQVLGVFQSQAQINAYTDKNGNILQPGANPGDFIYKYNSNGTLDTAFLGAYQPKTYIGISAGLTYKSFDLSIDLYGNIGNQVYNGKLQARTVYTDNIEKSVATSYWTPSNHSNTQPSANGGNLPASSYFLSSGTFARINNITIGYNMPSAFLSKQKVISSLRIFIDAQNPVTLKKYSGFSSELPSASTVYNGSALTANTLIPVSTATNAGIDYNTYPTTRTFAAGINIGF